jgi:hypothetical protein
MGHPVKGAETVVRARSDATRPDRAAGNALEQTENALAIAMNCR